jgi:hypothetical protein
MENRRRSPIPPPREARSGGFRDRSFRDDYRGGGDRRRPRSLTPERGGRGRSPPPGKRYRRDDDYD